jgi:hypothetical protein
MYGFVAADADDAAVAAASWLNLHTMFNGS